MKKYIILLVLAITLFAPSFGQVTKEMYENAVDLLNCKTVELTLKGDNAIEYKKHCPCGNVTFAEIEKFLNSIGKLDATLALSEEVENLKKSYKENWQTEEVLSFLTEGIFGDDIKYQKIFAFAEKRRGPSQIFDIFLDELKIELKNLLVSINEEGELVIKEFEIKENDFEERIKAIENRPIQPKATGGFLGNLSDYLIIFSIILAVLTIVLALRKKDSFEEMITKLLSSDRLKNLIRIQISNFSKFQNQNYNPSEIRDLHNRIRDLESQLQRLNIFMEKSQTSKIVDQPKSQSGYLDNLRNEAKSETFFLSTPNSDGSFNESSASNTYKDGASIYKLFKTGNRNARFQIDEKETSIKLALQYPDKNIDPICDAENAFNPKASRISTIKLGTAELQNGKWIITTKAVIRYEN